MSNDGQVEERSKISENQSDRQTDERGKSGKVKVDFKK